jgi:hypothetical protein
MAMMRDPMDYMLFGGGMTAFDWATIFALFAISVVYFIAPPIGYTSSGRGLIFASLWLLLAKFGLSLVKYALIFFELVENRSSGSSPGRTRFLDEPALLMLFFLMESGLLVMAMVLFVCGLGALRRPLPVSTPVRRDLHED